MIAKLSKSISIKQSTTTYGQRELIREMRNKINELIDVVNKLTDSTGGNDKILPPQLRIGNGGGVNGITSGGESGDKTTPSDSTKPTEKYGKCPKCGYEFNAENEERDFGCGMCGYSPLDSIDEKPTKSFDMDKFKDLAEKTKKTFSEDWESEFDDKFFPEKSNGYVNGIKNLDAYQEREIKAFIRTNFISKKEVKI